MKGVIRQILQNLFDMRWNIQSVVFNNVEGTFVYHGGKVHEKNVVSAILQRCHEATKNQ